MIASHNTFSYLQPRYKIFNFFKGFWRCQDKNINEQLASGVEYLDVRVRYTSDGMVRLCHGFVDYGKEYDSLHELLYYEIECRIPRDIDIRYRLVLERGDSSSFEDDVKAVIRISRNGGWSALLDWAIRKEGWVTVYCDRKPLEIIDRCFKKWSVKNIILSIMGVNMIRRFSDRMGHDDVDGKLVFMDFVKGNK